MFKKLVEAASLINDDTSLRIIQARDDMRINICLHKCCYKTITSQWNIKHATKSENELPTQASNITTRSDVSKTNWKYCFVRLKLRKK